jgi:predicted small lipoprotein YifL
LIIRLRQLSMALAILLALLALAGCQPKGPKIEISPAERDLGQVQQIHLETTYTVRNNGNLPLEINKVYTNCDCTKASVESTSLAPGAETILHVTMDPAQLNLYGNIRRDIILETNDPRTPVAKAVLKVSIQKP